MKLKSIIKFFVVFFLITPIFFIYNNGLANTQKALPIVKHQIVKIFVNDRTDVEKLANLGLDLAEVRHNEKYVISVITKEELKKVAELGLKYNVINEDASTIIYKASKAGTLKKYHTFEQIEKILKETEEKYSNICKLHVIGKSFEGRPIYALNVTTNPNTPSVLIMGLHHAREWISAEVPIALINELTEKYSKDETIKNLVDNRNIWIVPVVNPDGLIYSQTKYTMWRKNRRLNSNNTYGVDLNRNYGYQWGNVGASSNPSSDTYHGTEPFSESCTKAIKELAEKQKFRCSISFHSYSELVLYPFGYAYNAIAKDDKLLNELAVGMSKFNKYRAQKSSDLYPAMGDSDDWLYGAMGVLAFTIELGRQFIPDDNEVDKICADNVKACLYLIEKADKVYASNHPDFASKIQQAMSTFDYYLNTNNPQSDIYKTQLINLLNPANDVDKKNFEEFISELDKNENIKNFIPILKEVKEIYTQNIVNSNNVKQTLRDIEKMQSLIEKASY